jgi:YegS/Rv2252/BmrU family lipid kinase
MALICNVRSGRGGVARALPAVEAALKERKLEYEILSTEYQGHAIELTREALERGIRLVVAVGGDGTVHEVVNGMVRDDKPINPDAALGVVSAGSGCDFIKTFGLPPDPVASVKHLDGPNSFTIDVGKIVFEEDGTERTRYFANIAEAGLGADCVERASRLPRWLGPTMYLIAFWLTMRKHKPANVEIDLVDRVYKGPMNNLVVANGQFFGGGMKIAPKAAPTDGLLDIQIEHARKRDAIALIPKIFKGEHLPHPDIDEAKRVGCHVDADRRLRIEADGEVLGLTPASFEVLPDLISLKV